MSHTAGGDLVGGGWYTTLTAFLTRAQRFACSRIPNLLQLQKLGKHNDFNFSVFVRSPQQLEYMVYIIVPGPKARTLITISLDLPRTRRSEEEESSNEKCNSTKRHVFRAMHVPRTQSGK